MSESWTAGRMLQEIWKEVRGLGAKLDKVKNDTTVIKGQVIQIDSRLDGVEGDIRDVKQDIATMQVDLGDVKNDIAGIRKDIESGEDWKDDRK